MGCVPYPESEKLQKRIEQQRFVGEVPDTLLLVEHPHMYTRGRSATHDDILIDSEELRKRSLEVFQCDRGGRVTYHGPGQLVGYLIMNLRERRLSVPRFVWHVEEGIRRCLLNWGIASGRQRGRPGLWYQGRKLVSVGFHISRGVSRHGFSINISSDLRYFDWIIPCGYHAPVSSLVRELNTDISMERVGMQLVESFDQVFSSPPEAGSLCSS
jgi:lipoate-protein ligase B